MHRFRGMLGFVVAALSVLAITTSALAQQATYTVTGRVRDAEGGAPLPSVQVVIQGTRYGVLTNEQGSYTILAQLSPGTYTVEAQSIGRETGRQSITVAGDRLVNVPDFNLRAAALSLKEMGYLKVSSLAGGFDAWSATELPIAKPASIDFD